MRILKAFAVSVALIGLASCVSTNSTMLGGSQAGVALDPASIVVYRTADQVQGPYREVALLNSTGESLATNQRNMFNSMKAEAARLGANAIILESMSEPGAGAQVAAAIFGVGANRRGRAVAIDVAGLPHTPAPVRNRRSSATATR